MHVVLLIRLVVTAESMATNNARSSCSHLSAGRKASVGRRRVKRFGHEQVRVYRGVGVSRGVRLTTWERSFTNREL